MPPKDKSACLARSQENVLRQSAVVEAAISTLVLWVLLLLTVMNHRQFRWECVYDTRKTKMGTMTKVLLTNPHSVGNDGSQAFVYVKQPLGSGYGKWRVHLQGGGLCYDLASCAQRAIDYPDRMTYNNMPAEHDMTGLLSDSPSINPLWNYGAVYIHYGCSDFFDGQGNSGSWKFHGRSILFEAFSYIKTFGVTELLISGSSAGGVSVLTCIDWVALLFPGAKVSGLCDAGWLLDRTPFDPALVSPRGQLERASTYWHPDAILDGTRVGERCYLSTCFNALTNKERIFVQISQLDPVQLSALGVTNVAAASAYVNSFSKQVLTSLNEQGVTGFYSPRTATHGLALGNDFTDAHIAQSSLRDVFMRWYLGVTGAKKVFGA